VTTLGHDLVAAGAALGEEVVALREAAALGMRRGDRRAGPEGCDVGRQRLDLALGEEDVAAARLHADVRERHVARAQVEVGSERADADQRRADPGVLALGAQPSRADRTTRRALAARRVAGEAVAAVEVVTLLHRVGRGSEREAERREGRDEERALHPWRHVTLRIAAKPSSRMIIRKITFATAAAIAKKRTRPGGGGLS